MKKELVHIKVLFQRLLVLLFLFTCCRFLFYAFNTKYFPALSGSDWFWILLNGLRFDVAAIVYINSVFILLHLVPNPWREARKYQQVLKVFFYLFNLVALGFEATDFAYFRYSLKRITSDITFMEHDAASLMPTFIRDFWYCLAIVIGLLLIGEFFYRKTERNFYNLKKMTARFVFRVNYKMQTALALLTIGILFIAARGGVQDQPINPNTPAQYMNNSLCPLAQNTPFTLMYSITHQELKEVHFFTKGKAEEIFPVHHAFGEEQDISQYSSNGKKVNVVFIIVEGWSKEYSGVFNPQFSYTPFLDSLCREGLLFTNAFANAKKSIEGVPAVLSAIPAMMNDPLLSSEKYNDNDIESIASYLKGMGYSTSFFHGGSNGTMNFDQYAEKAGFDQYYGMNEYPESKRDFDGNWGIFDEPFLQFFANKLSEQSQPFCSSLFTLTSHHPFSLPKKYENSFKKDDQPIGQVMQYTDFAIRKFFETASKESWFQNTLFIITADHCGPPVQEQYKTRPGLYQVPILFYQSGSNLRGCIDYLVQHNDILPTVLDYLNYEGGFTAFGSSMFQNEPPHYAVSYLGGTYQILDDKYALLFDGHKSIEMYDYKSDLLCSNNLIGKLFAEEEILESHLKAAIQQYNFTILHNGLSSD